MGVFQEYEEMLPLAPGSLDPEGWPREVEGRPLSVRERHRDFVQQLDETYRRLQRQEPSATNSPRPAGERTASATPANSRPQLVLKSLLLLRCTALADI